MDIKYTIVTPSGFRIPISRATENEVWEKYCKIVGLTRDKLHGMGYRTMVLDGRRLSS